MANHSGSMAIALLDILGFKALIEEMTPEQLYEATLGHFAEMLERAADLHYRGEIKSAAFSDSLFLWSFAQPMPDGQPDAFACVEDMCITVYWLMHAAMRRCIPLRGAIAYGHCLVADGPLGFIGKPIVEAYQLERAQAWAGVSLHPSAAVHLGTIEEMYGAEMRPFVRYDVPMSQGGTKSLVAIKWPQAIDVPHPREAMRPPRPGLDSEERASVERKIANTTAFYERFVSQFKPYVDKNGNLVVAEFVARRD
jgi:hypothetical protein